MPFFTRSREGCFSWITVSPPRRQLAKVGGDPIEMARRDSSKINGEREKNTDVTGLVGMWVEEGKGETGVR